MKKTIFLGAMLLMIQNIKAQCDTFSVPYVLDVENVTVPQLPDCSSTNWDSFSSQEVFESIAGPIDGFDGQLLAYDTFAEISGVSSPVSANFTTYKIYLEQDVEYQVSYKYKNSNPDASIDYLSVSLLGDSGNNVQVSAQQGVEAPTATTFTSGSISVTSSGEYRVYISLSAQPNQGMFYLDDITVSELSQMGVEDNYKSQVYVYPNPTSDKLIVNKNGSTVDKIEFYSLTGQLLKSEIAKSEIQEIDITNFTSGIYLVQLLGENGAKSIKIYKE